MSTHTIATEDVVSAYIACALWSTNADHLDPEGTGSAGYLEDHFDRNDIAEEAMRSIREDVECFLSSDDEGCQAALTFWADHHGAEQIGHDFWLTRNGHGAGFWDRWGADTEGYAHGRVLTAMSKPYGESYWYAGDDGKVYVSS